MEPDLSMPLVPFVMEKVWGESALSALARERTTQANSFVSREVPYRAIGE